MRGWRGPPQTSSKTCTLWKRKEIHQLRNATATQGLRVKEGNNLGVTSLHREKELQDDKICIRSILKSELCWISRRVKRWSLSLQKKYFVERLLMSNGSLYTASGFTIKDSPGVLSWKTCGTHEVGTVHLSGRRHQLVLCVSLAV